MRPAVRYTLAYIPDSVYLRVDLYLFMQFFLFSFLFLFTLATDSVICLTLPARRPHACLYINVAIPALVYLSKSICKHLPEAYIVANSLPVQVRKGYSICVFI